MHIKVVNYAVARNLTELYIDNNLLDALPGIFLKINSLERVHRHGNHNYFKATFMWYHTDVNDRILECQGIQNIFNRCIFRKCQISNIIMIYLIMLL